MTPYRKTVFRSTEDCGYIAEATDLEYCSAFGETPEKAVQELEIAIQAWLQSAKENGRRIPPPTNTILTTGTKGSFQSKTIESDQRPQLTVEQELVPA
jgi:predicted RNase H-like HicB family nuclease